MINDYKIITAKDIDAPVRLQLLELWNNEYPQKLNYTSLATFDEYLTKLNKLRHFLVVDNQNKAKGWAFSFERDNERWFAIIVSEKYQNKGIGLQLLNHLKNAETELNGWVIDHNNDVKKNGKIYNSPLAFYKKSNFEVLEQERFESEKISAVKIKWMNNHIK
jgi:GNAT superfamily N-acetyltransferase